MSRFRPRRRNRRHNQDEASRSTPAPSKGKDRGARAGVPHYLHAQTLDAPLGIDARTRAELEPRAGGDLRDGRVHAGPESTAAARALGATAFTVGRDVVFDDGRFAPETEAGRRLLAHELAHVAQQRDAGSGRPEGMSRPGDP